MFLLLLHTPRRTPSLFSLLSTDIAAASSSSSLMASKHLLKTPPLYIHPIPSSSSVRLFHAYKINSCHCLPKPMSSFRLSCVKTNGSPYSSQASIPRPVHLETAGENNSVIAALNVLKKKLEELDMDLEACQPGQYNSLLCPACKGGNKMEKSLSLYISPDGASALWKCFRGKCGWKGSTKAFANRMSSAVPLNLTKKSWRDISVQSLELQPLCTELVAYFAERLISAETLRRNAVMQKKCNNQIVIAFTYRRKGKLISCKYRDVNKKFWQEADTEKIFYGLDDIEGQRDMIIVEGEMDKLAMEEAGFRNCVSVPDGAPPTISQKDLPAEEHDTKYQYLWNCKDYLKDASRIILATDGDPPGQALAEELARRLGRERCWRVRWPKKSDSGYFKDANEVLMYMGPVVLKEVVESAELYPIRGLFSFRNFFDEIDAYYNRTVGYEFGVPTGWRALNELYNVVPGELTIVSGVPNSGKSEWIDALLCNLNRSVGWKFVLCSMENKVREHARKLLEKRLKKPFFNARYGEQAERISAEELSQGKRWLEDTFYLIRHDDDALPSIKWVLDLAKSAVLRHGVQGLVIDPYNELDHQRPSSQTETEYVSQMLTLVKRFAQHHSCHVWFVAHPKQLQNWSGDPPNLYDISGSAHFINKCDNGIVIHRNRNPDAGPLDQVKICVRKVRNKVAGTIGEALLSYDRVTGRFMDIDEASEST